MATLSSRDFFLRNRLLTGFSLIEAMVSIAIIGLLSVVVVLDLRSTKRREELIAAARIIAGDLRSLQSRALSAQNLKLCLSGAQQIVCENSSVICGGPCVPAPPFSFGVHFKTAQSSYAFFADADQNAKDRMETPGGGELFTQRELAKLGAPNVQLTALIVEGSLSKTDVHAAFERQNGKMHLKPCISEPPACAEVNTLKIQLTHAQSGESKTVAANALTGRISIQ